MPTGVYPRNAKLMKQIRKNLAKGRSKTARAKAAASIREIASNPEWRKRVSEATKKAMMKPAIRKKHLKGLSKAFGYDYDNLCEHPPLSATAAMNIAHEYVRRFWSRVKIGNPKECWPWQGGNRHGYGNFSFPSCQAIGTHRFVMMLKLGRWLVGDEQALHHCDNPPCCNPDHLFLGDVVTNVADKMKKGRFYNGRGPKPKALSNKGAK